MSSDPTTRLLLDAFAVIAVLRGEPAAEELRPHLVGGGTVIHPLNLAEVLDRMGRGQGVDADDVDADVRLLGISVGSTEEGHLVDAGRLRARHYRRQVCEVSLADCVAATYAISRGLTLATADGPLSAVVRLEGGAILPLPNSRGQRP